VETTERARSQFDIDGSSMIEKEQMRQQSEKIPGLEAVRRLRCRRNLDGPAPAEHPP
jgi:hypothetical protein